MRNVGTEHPVRVSSALLASVLSLGLVALSAACVKRAESPQEAPQEAQTAPLPSTPAADNHPPSLECLLVLPKTITLGEPIELSFLVRNVGPGEVWVLKWQTPLEDFRADVLRIDGEAGTVAYAGPMVKRGDPSREEYVHLDPGASTERVVDLANAYPIAAPGHYRLSFNRGLMDVTSREEDVPRRLDQLRRFPLACPTVEFKVGPAKGGS